MNEKAKRVQIKYQFFQLCTAGKMRDELYDLREWINRIYEIDYEKRIKETNGITGRLEEVALAHNNEFYALNMMRMDVVSNTYVLTANEVARHVDLEDDEYIGQNTVMLYDPKRSVVMIQCNRGSYGTSGIESYINSFNEGRDICYFRPIDNKFVLNSNPNRRYFKLDVRFANTREFHANNSREFENILKSCNESNCLTAHIELGVGYNYNKEKELDPETIQNAILDLIDERNKDSISSARVTLTDDQKSEVYNLFENIMFVSLPFVVEPRGMLSFEVMVKKMADEYEEDYRARIYNLLN